MRIFNIDEFISIYNSYQGCKNTINYWFLKNYSDLSKCAEDNCKFWNIDNKKLSLTQKIIFLILGIHNYQHCPVCGKITYNLPDIKRLNEYKNNLEILTMCKSCYYKSPLYQDKMKQSYLEKYGVDNPNKLQSIKDKIQKTLHDHYGSDGLKSKEIHDKKVATCIEKYGTEYSCQSKEVKDKIRSVFDEKYNGHPLRNEEVKKKFQNTCLQHFGETHFMKNQDVKDKIYQSNLLNHSGEYFTNREKSKETCIQRFGVDNVSKNEDIKKKKIESTQKKFGVDYTFQSNYVKEVSRKTLLERYGVDNPSKNKEIHQKQVDTITRIKRENSYRRINESSSFEILTSIEDYVSGLTNIRWKCKTCGNIIVSKKDTNQQYCTPRCWTCHPYIPSKYENEIYEYIVSLLNENEVFRHNTEILNRKEIDIYIPNKNLAIEFDGLYWHSSEYQSSPYYHLNKTKGCLLNNIQLIHIFEDEWILKKDIVTNRLKSILGFYDNIVYARKCQVKEVSNKDSQTFLDNNHLQGYISAKINIGLYYNDELISIMTFGSYRKALGKNSVPDEYEMYRFSNKRGYHIPGAASKLLTYFERKYFPKKIISYADRRWSIGKLYESIGFKFVKFTDVNYYYIINGIRENRFKWRKSELPKLLENFNHDLTEQENMANNGYYQIFDCGNYLFEKIY